MTRLRYDAKDDVLENVEKRGAYHILSDDFLDQIQSWTRRQGTIVEGNTASAREEMPYPPVVLREVLANAVAHALYQREQGGIIVDIHPDRLTVRNNALLEAKAFSRQWFAKKTFVKNKLLMGALRAAKICDELGSGKARIFRLLIEAGKQEPSIEFTDMGMMGKWEITIYNHERDGHFKALLSRIKDVFPTAHHARIAAALILWRDHSWTSILERLDEHFTKIAIEVIEHPHAPVIVVDNELLTKRWVDVALTGHQSRTFSPAEERKIFEVLKAYSFRGDRKGFITTDQARGIIGLGASQAETTQLSNLFRKWREAKHVSFVKRGHWKFLSDVEKKTVLMSDIAKSFQEVVEALQKNKPNS